jgi:hypothetical protein
VQTLANITRDLGQPLRAKQHCDNQSQDQYIRSDQVPNAQCENIHTSLIVGQGKLFHGNVTWF